MRFACALAECREAPSAFSLGRDAEGWVLCGVFGDHQNIS